MTLSKLMAKLLGRAVRQCPRPGQSIGCLTVGKPSHRRYWSVNYDGKKRNAHQGAWEFYNGPIPEGFEVCHTCDNGRCIEKSHLWLGTHAENMVDRDIKGRNGMAKLTEESVANIREQYRNGATTIDLAVEFNVSQSNISAVVLGKTWRHLLPSTPSVVEERRAA